MFGKGAKLILLSPVGKFFHMIMMMMMMTMMMPSCVPCPHPQAALALWALGGQVPPQRVLLHQ